MKKLLCIIPLVLLVCLAMSYRKKAEKAEVAKFGAQAEIPSAEKHAHGKDAGAPANPMAFMINVYNAFEDPVRFLRNIAPALKPGGTLAIVLDDPAKSRGESERSATREEFLAGVDKAGYKIEKEETFLERDGLYVLRFK
jgi:hypothetical protein